MVLTTPQHCSETCGDGMTITAQPHVLQRQRGPLPSPAHSCRAGTAPPAWRTGAGNTKRHCLLSTLAPQNTASSLHHLTCCFCPWVQCEPGDQAAVGMMEAGSEAGYIKKKLNIYIKQSVCITRLPQVILPHIEVTQ